MGDFRIEVNATGGHGCQRELKDGASVKECGDPNCPDCIARRFVAELPKDALPTIVHNLVIVLMSGNF